MRAIDHTMTISNADITDCEEIISLQKLAYKTEAEHYQDWTIPPLTQTSDELRKEFSELFVLKAVHNTRIIGSVRAQVIDDVCHIARLIVDPRFQGKGIGTALLHAIEASCKHAKSYSLFTGDQSAANIQLYQRLGYVITHTQELSEKIRLVYLRKDAS